MMDIFAPGSYNAGTGWSFADTGTEMSGEKISFLDWVQYRLKAVRVQHYL